MECFKDEARYNSLVVAGGELSAVTNCRFLTHAPVLHYPTNMAIFRSSLRSGKELMKLLKLPLRRFVGVSIAGFPERCSLNSIHRPYSSDAPSESHLLYTADHFALRASLRKVLVYYMKGKTSFSLTRFVSYREVAGDRAFVQVQIALVEKVLKFVNSGITQIDRFTYSEFYYCSFI